MAKNQTEIKDTIMKGYEDFDVALEVAYDVTVGSLLDVESIVSGVFYGSPTSPSARPLSEEEIDDLNQKLQTDKGYLKRITDKVEEKLVEEDPNIFEDRGIPFFPNAKFEDVDAPGKGG